MRKCEKDFRQVFSFLLCLLDALPLSNLNFRKGKGLLTSRIIEDKRQSCLASYESLGFWVYESNTSLTYLIVIRIVAILNHSPKEFIVSMLESQFRAIKSGLTSAL